MSFEDEEAVLPDESGIISGVNADGTNISTGKQEDTPAEATAEKSTEQTPSSEGGSTPDDKDLPAHLQPAWIAREERFTKQLEKAIGETKSEYEKRMVDLESRLPHQEQVIPTSPFLKKLVGEDPELAKDWEIEKESIRQATIEAYEAKQQEMVETRQAEEKRWLNWVDTSLTNLRTSGKEFDDNELKNIALKYKPTDELGNIDFNLAYELLMETKAKQQNKEAEKSLARKQLAADTASTIKGEAPQREYLTHADIRRGASNF